MISKGYKILEIFCRSLFTFSKFVIPVLWRDFSSEFWAHSLKSCLSVQRPSHIVFPVFSFSFPGGNLQAVLPAVVVPPS